jgi:hypothetical protein
MDLQAWIYVAPVEAEGEDALVELIREVAADLKPRQAAGEFAGYTAMALAGPDDYDAGDIDPDIVEEVTGGQFPAIYLNITYDLGLHRPVIPATAELLVARGFVHVLTYPDDPSVA